MRVAGHNNRRDAAIVMRDARAAVDCTTFRLDRPPIADTRSIHRNYVPN